MKYEYDLAGDQRRIMTMGGASQELEYDAWGRITGIVDGNGSETKYLLDEWGRITGVRKADGSTERYEKLREVFELDEKRPIRRFSKGMQKQAAFWLALSAMPDYLILDEPVDGLDPVMRRQVWSLMMGDVAERGTTVLVSSHNLRELEDVCDHVGIMDHGHVLLERSLAQLQDNMVKLQVVFPDGMEDVPAELPVLHASKLGRVHTLIMRMNAQEAAERLMAYSPLLVDAIPLTLEEIFIYELGGADYAVKDIVL